MTMQRIAIADIQDGETTPTQKAALMSAWEKLERLKREMRGIPPLKAIDSPKWPRRARAKLIDAGDAAIEIEAKESLSTPTVTAPPTPDAPTAT